jgi:oligoribonuclease NrnB/cAMP/cGMP phosphodiesterase (DHH superfamily)
MQSINVVCISHSDCDGILSASVLFKHFGTSRIKTYFTSAAKLKLTLCRAVMDEYLDQLYVFDLAADTKLLKIASVFEKIVWIDHHVWDDVEIPDNVQLIIDSSSLSATSLVSKYFNNYVEFAEIANEIDVNNVKTDRAKFFRNLISAVKWSIGANALLLARKLREIAHDLAFSGIEKFETDTSIASLLNEYNRWVAKIEKEILNKIKVFKTDGLKVAIYESTYFVPIYLIYHKLLEHQEAPFDIIAILYHTMGRRIETKIELRTHTNKDILFIAKHFGGGGHRVACGATLSKLLFGNELVEIIKNLV